MHMTGKVREFCFKCWSLRSVELSGDHSWPLLRTMCPSLRWYNRHCQVDSDNSVGEIKKNCIQINILPMISDLQLIADSCSWTGWSLHVALYPAKLGCYSGVHTRVTCKSTARPPAHHSYHRVGSITLPGHQGSTTVSLTRVLPSLASCTDHVGGDVGAGVLHGTGGALQRKILASILRNTNSHLAIGHCIDRDLLEDTWLTSSLTQSSPSWDHSSDTVVVVGGAGW